MLTIAAHQLLEALTGRLDVVDCILDKLSVDWSSEVGELTLVLDPQIIGQGFQADGDLLLGEGPRRGSSRPRKLAALKLELVRPDDADWALSPVAQAWQTGKRLIGC